MYIRRGSSLVMWSVTFSVLLAALFIFQLYLKRPLQGKIMQTTDYLMWTKWHQEPWQYKGDDTTASKTQTIQPYTSRLHEGSNSITMSARSNDTEAAKSSSVNDGSEPLLKTFDLNR